MELPDLSTLEILKVTAGGLGSMATLIILLQKSVGRFNKAFHADITRLDQRLKEIETAAERTRLKIRFLQHDVRRLSREDCAIQKDLKTQREELQAVTAEMQLQKLYIEAIKRNMKRRSKIA